MSRRWTKEERGEKKKELFRLYVEQNKTIKETGKIQGISEQTVYSRLKRLGIKTIPHLKEGYTNKRKLGNVIYSEGLAEFIGIMWGDGHISKEQVFIYLGTKERKYADRIQLLFRNIFGEDLRLFMREGKYIILYIGFVELIVFLKKMGLVEDKVKYQVGVPSWILNKEKFMRGFIRGFFDTDGSIYKLRWGNQISFTNKSFNLLEGTHVILKKLGFSPSKISGFSVYLTRRQDLLKFYKEIGSSNQAKYLKLNKIWVGTEVAKRGAL